jgi:hypothetical protein
MCKVFSAAALEIVDYLRRRFPRFKLGAGRLEGVPHASLFNRTYRLLNVK